MKIEIKNKSDKDVELVQYVGKRLKNTSILLKSEKLKVKELKAENQQLQDRVAELEAELVNRIKELEVELMARNWTETGS